MAIKRRDVLKGAAALLAASQSGIALTVFDATLPIVAERSVAAQHKGLSPEFAQWKQRADKNLYSYRALRSELVKAQVGGNFDEVRVQSLTERAAFIEDLCLASLVSFVAAEPQTIADRNLQLEMRDLWHEVGGPELRPLEDKGLGLVWL